MMTTLEQLKVKAKQLHVLVTMRRPVVDVCLRVPHIPRPGEKALAQERTAQAGGVDGNFAASMANIGLRVTAVGSDSTDAIGDVDKQSLRRTGVTTVWDDASAGPATVCYVTIDEAAERAIVISYPDDDKRIDDAVLAAITNLPAVRWDLAYLGVFRSDQQNLLSHVRTRAELVAVTLETSDWPGPCLANRINQIDLVFCAKETYEAHAAELAKLRSRQPFALVVTDGARGSRYITEAGPGVVVPAHIPEGPIVDTTGAGDAFASAFCAAWLLGVRGVEALRAANWYAAQKIQRSGARAHPPGRDFLAHILPVAPVLEGTANS